MTVRTIQVAGRSLERKKERAQQWARSICKFRAPCIVLGRVLFSRAAPLACRLGLTSQLPECQFDLRIDQPEIAIAAVDGGDMGFGAP